MEFYGGRLEGAYFILLIKKEGLVYDSIPIPKPLNSTQSMLITRRHYHYGNRIKFPSYPFIHYFCWYLSPTPLFTAGLSPIRSIHFIKCGNASISSAVNPLNSHAFTHGQVPMSATEYFPAPLPARYSRGDPVYFPDSWISSTP